MQGSFRATCAIKEASRVGPTTPCASLSKAKKGFWAPRFPGVIRVPELRSYGLDLPGLVTAFASEDQIGT
jgi:hypothetical protein